MQKRRELAVQARKEFERGIYDQLTPRQSVDDEVKMSVLLKTTPTCSTGGARDTTTSSANR